MIIYSRGKVAQLLRVEEIKWQFDDLCQEIMDNINIDNRIAI